MEDCVSDGPFQARSIRYNICPAGSLHIEMLDENQKPAGVAILSAVNSLALADFITRAHAGGEHIGPVAGSA